MGENIGVSIMIMEENNLETPKIDLEAPESFTI